VSAPRIRIDGGVATRSAGRGRGRLLKMPRWSDRRLEPLPDHTGCRNHRRLQLTGGR
jgi:hypothetical protein